MATGLHSRKIKVEFFFFLDPASTTLIIFRQEEKKEERLVAYNADWLALVPYWAVWPYETMIIPRHRHILRYSGLPWFTGLPGPMRL